MLLEVKCRTFDPLTRRPRIEPLLIEVPSGSGDDAAEMAHALRPGCHVVGIAPPDAEAAKAHAERAHAALEGESEAPDMSRDRPSARDLAQYTPLPPRNPLLPITVDTTTYPIEYVGPVIELSPEPKRGRGKKAPADE